MAVAWVLEGMEVDRVCEDERGFFAVLTVPGIDGSLADVYGEDEAEARQSAEAIIQAVEAAAKIDTLQAELTACRQMCQRLATESGDSVAWALKMGVQNGSIQLTPLDFRGWDEGCDCAECQQQRAVYAWLFGGGQR